MAARPPKRDDELSTNQTIRKKLVELYADVLKGFQDQRQRSDGLMDNWDLYNCKLGDAQFYNGNSRIFMPYVHDAVNARKTRFVNQIFPQSGRYVEVTTVDGEIPHATMALLESYVRQAKLRTEVMPALMKNGDIEGQYSVYVGWEEFKRQTVRREKVADVAIKDIEFPELGEHDDYVEDEETLARPTVEVVHDADLLILPVTVNSVEQAIEAGGSVTVLRRWGKGRIRKAISDGEIVKEAGEALLKAMQKASQGEQRDTGKDMADAAGIKGAGGHSLIYETWSRVKVKGEHRLCRIYYAGDDLILGCKLCPYWCDRVPVITAPIDKTAGVIKCKPPVDAVYDLNILANDTINEGADTSHFAAMPIVMTDPEKNPKVDTMVLGLAAVWATDPKSTQFAQFPELWRTAVERAEAIKGQIFQTLGVNPSMIPGSAATKKKMNQAEIANEQQVDILTTADAVTVIEEGILTPLLQRFAEYDHQFRDEKITIRVYGEMGLKARMEEVDPLQLNNRWEFRWYGVEAARNAAAMQQQIAGMNVMKGIPPDQYQGYRLDLAPLMVQMAENLFGPRLAPLIFVKQEPITVDPMLENEMLEWGHHVKTNEADDDQAHLAEHMLGMQTTGDPHGTFRDHIQQHQQQIQKKAQAMMQQQMAQGAPGGPGGAGPGVAGTPKPGAQPGTSRVGRGPAGMIHQDRMGAADPSAMPRKM